MGINSFFKKEHNVDEKSYVDKMAEIEAVAMEEPGHDQETEEEKTRKRLEEFDKKRHEAEQEKIETEQNKDQEEADRQKEILKAIESETDSAEEQTQETMVIGKGTELTGNLNSEEAIELLGTVYGNITSKADIKLLGKVRGDVCGLGVEVSSSSIQGNITADKKITVDSSSTIIGNISAEEIIVNGKIKGNLKAAESIQIKENTVFIGNASAKVISVAPGAVIRGKVEITTDHKEDQIFSAITVENNISVGERRKPDGFSIPIQ